MRAGNTFAITVAATVLSATVGAGAQLQVRQVEGPPGEEAASCDAAKKACIFSDLSGTNVYTVAGESLKRTERDKELYNERLADAHNGIRLLLAGVNKARSLVVIAAVQETRSVGDLLRKEQLPGRQVQHWLSLRNPKTGDEVKRIDLGMFKPAAMTLTSTGVYLWVFGEDAQLRRREVRAYNARSGKQELVRVVDNNADVHLFERGFQVASAYYAADLESGSQNARRYSANPYSIAEFTVSRSKTLSLKDLTGVAIGVAAFQDSRPEIRDLLQAALAIKLAAAGFQIVERQQLAPLLREAQYQNLGLTDPATAAKLGRQVNAKYLLLGSLGTVGNVSSMTLHLANVENANYSNEIELECRDCSPDDYLEALTLLLRDWMEVPK